SRAPGARTQARARADARHHRPRTSVATEDSDAQKTKPREADLTGFWTSLARFLVATSRWLIEFRLDGGN
ncbi:hypothetical protein, partial [Nostoc favosum]